MWNEGCANDLREENSLNDWSVVSQNVYIFIVSRTKLIISVLSRSSFSRYTFEENIGFSFSSRAESVSAHF